jgi:hypothetical protein
MELGCRYGRTIANSPVNEDNKLTVSGYVRYVGTDHYLGAITNVLPAVYVKIYHNGSKTVTADDAGNYSIDVRRNTYYDIVVELNGSRAKTTENGITPVKIEVWTNFTWGDRYYPIPIVITVPHGTAYVHGRRGVLPVGEG